jgi:hypothetical protein
VPHSKADATGGDEQQRALTGTWSADVNFVKR